MPTPNLAFLIIVCSLTVLFVGPPNPAFSEAIDGFRELKFGMTEDEVQALERCSTSTECLYELAGKNRYLHLSYPRVKKTQDQPKLAQISIDMGRFSNEWYAELQTVLQNQYQLTHDLSGNDIDAFQNERLSELTSGYENGQVLLRVIRRKFGNLVLQVIYQNHELAATTFPKPTGSPQP